MEQHKKETTQRQKAPRIPIETYRWEDIRRARLRGGYPWTYLYKDEYTDRIDPDLFKMDARSKSASNLRRSSGLEIQDVTNGTDDNHRYSLTPEPSGYFVITEVPSDSESHSKSAPRGSFSIEDFDEPEVLNLEEAESSDDISQYLDKEELRNEAAASVTAQPEEVKEENGCQERAKSEEPKRKRKRSIDSSYSRKSLSKLAFIKKLKEAKDKIKVPKLSLPSLSSKKESTEQIQTEPKPKSKDKGKNLQPKTKESPVYIHIPLKPPEGETDEFSYLEFGEKKQDEEIKPETTPEAKSEVKPEEKEEKPAELEIKFESDRRFSGNPEDIVAFEIVKAETINLDEAEKNGLQVDSDYLIIQQNDDAKSENMIIIMPGAEERELSRSDSSKTPSRQGSRKVRAKSAEPERKRKSSIESSYSRISLSKLGLLKKLKDAKDKLIPKFSLGRTDSKKDSKKPKEEAESSKDAKQEVTNKESKKEEKKKESSDKHPKIIHIPLKPPPGETDEFSYLEFEEKKDTVTEAEEVKKEEESSIESPISPKAEGVQFIFLTPPSDDEILDPKTPETPSTETASILSDIEELQKIAKDAAEDTTPKQILLPVAEEDTSNSDESRELKGDEQAEKMVIDEEDGLKLTESAMALQEQNIKSKEVSEVKSSLKTDDGSPVLKKKVSFKRRSKDETKDGIYEDVQPPPDDKSDKASDEHKATLAVMGNSQSMSVDEEKSYLDEQKIIKSTSLEEDYNRWSKLSDHEYEPVNPPPDVTSAPPPTVHVIDTDQGLQQKPISLASSTTSLERRMLGADDETSPGEPLTIQEMQTEIENKYFTQPPQQSSKPQTTVETTVTTVTISEPESQQAPGKFHQALKTQADKFKSKLHGIKKPKIKLPSKPNIKKPNLPKFKIEKPKFHLPKMPDAPKITLPTFSLPRRPTKPALKERQFSTESNAGDSKRNYFDFRTYPRLFRKKQKDDVESIGSKPEDREFATVPRTKRNKDGDSMGDSEPVPLQEEDSVENDEREDSVERRMTSHIRYDKDIDTDDAFEKENQEIHAASPFSHDYTSRWNHGSFHPEPNLDFPERNLPVTDLDSPEDGPATHESFDINTSKDINSSESSLGIHRRGVLEEIDSDEFFLRQKGISQDNIEVGMYLSSEIREAFKSPTNALADLQLEPRGFVHEARDSNQSLPETVSKRKVVKKPKRKKTPHVSHEQISFDQDSELDTEIPPSRPKRRSRKNRKQREDAVMIPYQETIAADPDADILDEIDDEHKLMYENEEMFGKEQPEINVADTYARYESEEEVLQDEEVKPSAPPRKHKSLKSLNFSEHDSILGDFNDKIQPQDVEIYKTEHEYIIPTPELPPVKPERTLSRTSSRSRDQEETPIRPTRSRSRTSSRGESLTAEEPCVEEICVQDFRDYMGYAVIDKQNRREPPLPPPRTPPRRKRSIQSDNAFDEPKFFTVPRSSNSEPPQRPLRNYSTLGPSRPPRRKAPMNMTDEEKENIDITQYIEIDEEPNRDLHSGEVIQKMRDRPLPAPPRPPRKTRALQDITSLENIAIAEDDDDVENEGKEALLQEAEASTETDLRHEALDSEQIHEDQPETVERESTADDPVVIERRLITPTHYSYEETITHGSLVVEPLNGAKLLPDSQITRIERTEHTIPVTKDYDDETSEIPEEFMQLKDPPQMPTQVQNPIVERIIERPVVVQPDSNPEVEVLRAQKLQVSDLDVDRLSVNELLANRIVVSEIESGNIQTGEIDAKSGALKFGEMQLPPGIVQQLFERLQSIAQEQTSSVPAESKPVDKTETEGQKKTPIEEVAFESLPPQRPPRKTEEPNDSILADIEEPRLDLGRTQTDSLNISETEEIKEYPVPPERTDSKEQTPQRPPRHAERSDAAQEPEIDDVPPPRPPEPQIEYIPSQPPASFYALRAQQLVDDIEGDIPSAPRRRRHHHKPPISRSSSEDSPAPPPSRRRFKSPEPSIPQLTSQLIQACGSAANSSLKRLIAHISNNVLRNADGQQDLHVIVVILLVLIAGLILLGFGDGKTVHLHHWEFFNPPRDM